ncbi:glycosyltransferase [Ferruginibacter sp. HRS2-29]|uniref:glycosyltransferase n=1 Tax=Ferruginibacter sp. HRS2-29 TaxID=2487334 RepID=UPI0020CF7C2F|nr:glycosyltransferase [Ferruginibacter sp. HRS2-29]MCP9752193.1 glycosyltransferase [Ferruginibacter sp. HRS2-29]
MEHPPQIFQTSSSTRWKSFKWTSRIILVVAIFFIAVAVLAVINARNPDLPVMDARAKAYQDKLDPTKNFTFASRLNKKYKGFKDYLEKKLQEDSLKNLRSDAVKTTAIRSAFYTPWDKNALPDLIKNADKLNTIFPEWFFIDTTTYQLQTRIDTAGLSAMKNAHLSIQPILNNFHTNTMDPSQGYFDSKLLHVILTDAEKRTRLIRQIADTLAFYQLQGINVDFENLNEPANEPLTRFQKELYETLHPKGLLVSMDVQAMNEDYDFKSLSQYNDHVILMAYDQYSDATGPGPISAQKWIEQQLDWMDDRIDASKIILGVAGYGRDWAVEKNGKSATTTVTDLTYAQIISQAKIINASISFDNDTYNLHYDYTQPETDSAGETIHHIWFTDAATTFNILRFSDDYATAGTALWRLGGEDPRIWNFYGRQLSMSALQKTPFDFNLLQVVPIDFGTKPTSSGEGELLRILYSPQAGKIKLEVDQSDMLIAEQQYVQLPSGYVYEKFAEDKTEIGSPGHKIVLTFDDGPDEIYTPKILAILEKEKVPATFFVIGLNAERNVPLLQRLYRDGYEIGNHTFTHGNIAKMSPERAELEMKTTRSLIECVTGHSTILFRAPYNADSEPQTYEEIEPIARSKKDNYISVGESIDPNDWDPHMNADSIYNRTIRFAEQNNASIILLHDAGGNTRQPTVDALPRIIAYFKSRGCKFTTVADLMGKTKDDVMPPVPQTWKNKANWFVVEATYWGTNILFSLFIIGILLSVGRMALMGLFASIQVRREKKAAALLAGKTVVYPTPLVSVIVPAYNEEVNAVRTVESLLQQNYPALQVIFVDDGSKDNTFVNVQQAFEGHPRVQVHTKPNGGKASALNYGINIAGSEYVVCIDADTQLKNDAVTELMKKFDFDNTEEEVGAVAGNVKVGNEINMITRWQSIEYITSQNFDRRAFDLLDCITVVPGAIGAFKKTAIIKAGGFTTDTLAEDCDLTMRLHRIGYKVRNCNTAISYTEAPETMKQFMKQRFRWSFGVMQSFWKHRDATFNPKYKNFGMVAMPNILVFQMILPFLAPLADIILVLSLLAAGFGIIPASIGHIILYYLIFTLVDVAGAALAFAFEKEDYRKLVWLIPQRLIYRQLMYYILIKSFNKAIKGELQGWGALKRTGNVKQL